MSYQFGSQPGGGVPPPGEGQGDFWTTATAVVNFFDGLFNKKKKADNSVITENYVPYTADTLKDDEDVPPVESPAFSFLNIDGTTLVVIIVAIVGMKMMFSGGGRRGGF